MTAFDVDAASLPPAGVDPTYAGPSPDDATPMASDAMVLAAVCRRVQALAGRRRTWMEQAAAFTAAARAQRRERGRDSGEWLAHDAMNGAEEERAWNAQSPDAAPFNREIVEQTRILRADRQSRLAVLCRSLGLSEIERLALEVCLALALQPELAPLLAEVHGRAPEGQVTEHLVARLFGLEHPLLTEASPLLRWLLVVAHDGGLGEPRPLALDRQVVAFLLGSDAMDPALLDCARPLAPPPPLDDWPVTAVATRLARALDRIRSTRLVVVGRPGSGRRTFAACVAQALGGSALVIDTGEVSEADWPRVYVLAQRHALLHGLVPIWCGREVARRRPRLPAGAPIEVVTIDPELALPPLSDGAEERITLPALTIAQRRQLWLQMIPGVRALPAVELEQIAERYRLSIGDLTAIARQGVTTLEEARALCLEATRARLGELGQALECPFPREDLLLPPALDRTLDDFLFEARARARFWEGTAARRLFPRGRGLVGLMTGPPGTGKTMAVQVIARELGLDLVRIDLATCLSKYIGETAKNLHRIFAHAADMNAVLLFDEADALFSKRTEVRDAHDRYANTDTNYLLQLIEDFEGVALLTSNQKQNMDAAFTRRIRYLFDFPRPSPRERLLIWQRLVREMAGAERELAMRGHLGALATRLDLSGAQIKVSLLTAMFAAARARAPLDPEHLYYGINQELLKEGRSVSPHDRQRIEGGHP
jgi:hypothetical protein